MEVAEFVGKEMFEGEDFPPLAALAKGEFPMAWELNKVEENTGVRHSHLGKVGQHLQRGVVHCRVGGGKLTMIYFERELM